MANEDIETLIRRLLAAGMSVLVLFAAPAAGDGPSSDPPTVSVRPDAAGKDSPDRSSPDKSDNRKSDTGKSDTDEDDGRAESAGAATSAAVQHGWGRPTHVDEFSRGLGDDWQVYDGPGHEGKGERSPSAVSVENGIMTITGKADGTTAGMAWDTGQKYGRWEGRVRAPKAADPYHALMLLWPDAENWPVGGEVDFMEMTDGDRRSTNMFLHYGKDNSQVSDEVDVDATKWHNWAVEWTPKGITAFLDGEPWFRSTDPKTLPPGPMHLCIQLDWFPGDGASRTSSMQVDWVKQYSLDGSGADRAETASWRWARR
jgi:beta-glucanase (GH16 family)